MENPPEPASVTAHNLLKIPDERARRYQMRRHASAQGWHPQRGEIL